MRTLRNLHFLSAIVCGLTLTACLSFPGKQLPTFTYEQIVPQDSKPSIDYDAQYIRTGGELLMKSREQIFKEEIPEVFNKSKLFSKVTEGRGEKYHIFLILKNSTSTASTINGWISGLTLTIIPAYGK